MPRKRMYEPDRYDRPFPSRLREIMGETGTTQQALADYLGVKNRQSIGFYCDGRSYPDLDAVAKIAEYFHVTTDWLLGLSDVRKPDTTLQAVCEYTGLSEDAVKLLCGQRNWSGRYNTIISKIIEYGFTNNFLFWCNEYLCSKELLFEPVKFGTTQELIEMKEKLKEDYHAHVVFSETMAKVQFLDVTNLLRNTLDKIAEQEATHAEEK